MAGPTKGRIVLVTFGDGKARTEYPAIVIAAERDDEGEFLDVECFGISTQFPDRRHRRVRRAVDGEETLDGEWRWPPRVGEGS